MSETAEIRGRVREVLQDVLPGGAEIVEGALGRIMEAIKPFDKIAREELEHFRQTFSDLAK